MSKRIVQQHTRERQITVRQAVQSFDRKVEIQNLKREQPKVPVFSSTNLQNQIKSYTQMPGRNYYLGFGGLGDALLLMSSCWDDPKARVIFFANQIPFIKSVFELFGISLFIHENIMGTRMAAHIYDEMRTMVNFRTSAHLADGLDFNDWKHENKYIPRIRGHARWIQHLGKKETDTPVVIINPSGSSKDPKRQRYLHHHELHQLCDIWIKRGYRIYISGSLGDIHHFKLVDKPNCYWLHSDNIYDGKGNATPSNLTNMLRIINSAEHVISMDTWLKTYTLLCGIPTTVIETRWDGAYRPYGEDITDWIFLNFKIWPHLRLEKIEKLLAV